MDSLNRAIDDLDRVRAIRAAERDADERAAFLVRFPFEVFWADVQTRAAAAPQDVADEIPTDDRLSFRMRWARARETLRDLFASRRFVAVAATVAVVLVAGSLWLRWSAWPDGGGTVDSAPPGIRFRGSKSPTTSGTAGAAERSDAQAAGLQFFVWRDSAAVEGREGGVYREDEQIRFTYWSGENDYLVVLSIENSGQVTVYYPDGGRGEDPSRSLRIPRGRNIALEGSVVLNDYVGRERFFALFSTEPLSVAQVRETASRAFLALGGDAGDVRALTRLPLDVPQATFWIEKR